VLDADLRVIVASRSFSASQQEIQGRMLYELGNGQGDVAQLRRLLEDVLPSSSSIDGYEIEGASSPRLRSP
jgi:two-component system, chemotaxis family, CheB/CheR fusion protein